MLIVLYGWSLTQPYYAEAQSRTASGPRSWTARYNAEEDNDFGIWPQSIINYKYKKWRFELDTNPRIMYRATRLNEFHIRTFVGYQAKPWLLLQIGAYPYSPVYQPVTVNQVRLLEQVTLDKTWGRVGLTLRSRLDERWVEHVSKTAYRVRELPRVNYYLDESKHYYAFAADEVFVNFNTASGSIKKGCDQNRAFLGLGWNINQHAKFELAYLDQWFKRRQYARPLPDRHNHVLFLNLVNSF